MNAMKIWRAFFGICFLCLSVFSSTSCSKDEVDLGMYPNTEWRAKMGDGYVDKELAYLVIRFFADGRYVVYSADSGGMIYGVQEEGTYFVEGNEVKLKGPELVGGVLYYRSGDNTLNGEIRTAGYQHYHRQ